MPAKSWRPILINFSSITISFDFGQGAPRHPPTTTTWEKEALTGVQETLSLIPHPHPTSPSSPSSVAPQPAITLPPTDRQSKRLPSVRTRTRAPHPLRFPSLTSSPRNFRALLVVSRPSPTPPPQLCILCGVPPPCNRRRTVRVAVVDGGAASRRAAENH